ncbi:hypothetical protein OG596_35030 [Streptomyces sp. NBC_01102]|uniref:hypothetical protein n=1 Tax=unclassified Streptomyces TaxID=2593676 RepID=UPI00386EA758|nr:hypothetical protein OG596_35030 [Streptomyces sp. NBC_01102]
MTGEKNPTEVSVRRYPQEHDFLGLGSREKYAAAVRETNTVLQQCAFDLLAGIATAARLPDGGVLVLANDEDEDTPGGRCSPCRSSRSSNPRTRPEPPCAVARLIAGASQCARDEPR